MEEASLKGLAAEILLMSDRYERRARLAPGLFAVVPIAVLAYSSASTGLPWYQSLGLAVLIESLLALFAGHLARALGVSAERRLFPDGLPTHQWLSSSSPRSQQQREQWRVALLSLTRLDIYVANDPDEERKVIHDAVVQARGRLRGQPEAAMVQTHNEEYGFSRNLLGLVPVWFTASGVSAIATGLPLLHGGGSWLVFCTEAVLMAACVSYAAVGGAYVRWTAERYAESLLSAVLVATKQD